MAAAQSHKAEPRACLPTSATRWVQQQNHTDVAVVPLSVSICFETEAKLVWTVGVVEGRYTPASSPTRAGGLRQHHPVHCTRVTLPCSHLHLSAAISAASSHTALDKLTAAVPAQQPAVHLLPSASRQQVYCLQLCRYSSISLKAPSAPACLESRRSQPLALHNRPGS